MCLALCMSHILLNGLQEKESLLVVYWNYGIGQKQFWSGWQDWKLVSPLGALFELWISVYQIELNYKIIFLVQCFIFVHIFFVIRLGWGMLENAKRRSSQTDHSIWKGLWIWWLLSMGISFHITVCLVYTLISNRPFVTNCSLNLQCSVWGVIMFILGTGFLTITFEVVLLVK